MFRWLIVWLNRRIHPERKFIARVRRITGYTPRVPSLYKLAVQPSSQNRNAQPDQCNERLEFLGDAILGSITAEYLYQHYPMKTEGFLTEMRSKIVNRNSLNDLCFKLGLNELLEDPPPGQQHHRMVYGNMLEAFIGALFLDLGYSQTRSFILNRLLALHVDLKNLEENESNFKSRLMEFAQKHKLPQVNFAVVRERNPSGQREFTVSARLGKREFGQGSDLKKKTAEQKAAESALESLETFEMDNLRSELGVVRRKKGKKGRGSTEDRSVDQPLAANPNRQQQPEKAPTTAAPNQSGPQQPTEQTDQKQSAHSPVAFDRQRSLRRNALPPLGELRQVGFAELKLPQTADNGVSYRTESTANNSVAPTASPMPAPTTKPRQNGQASPPTQTLASEASDHQETGGAIPHSAGRNGRSRTAVPHTVGSSETVQVHYDMSAAHPLELNWTADSTAKNS